MAILHISINSIYEQPKIEPIALVGQEKKYMDITKIQLALLSLKEEREQIEEYLQNAAAKKKELDNELNASSANLIVNN